MLFNGISVNFETKAASEPSVNIFLAAATLHHFIILYSIKLIFSFLVKKRLKEQGRCRTWERSLRFSHSFNL
jgi:hypothetical protein